MPKLLEPNSSQTDCNLKLLLILPATVRGSTSGSGSAGSELHGTDAVGLDSPLGQRTNKRYHQYPRRRHPEQALIPETDPQEALPDSDNCILRVGKRRCWENSVRHSSERRRTIRLCRHIQHLAGPRWQAVKTFAIGSTAPNTLLAQVHNRMPVILEPAHASARLDTKSTDIAHFLDSLRPLPPDQLEMYPVSRRINWARNDSPDLIQNS